MNVTDKPQEGIRVVDFTVESWVKKVLYHHQHFPGKILAVQTDELKTSDFFRKNTQMTTQTIYTDIWPE
jgi:hypothetical protein